jgi:hypothetical protein
VDYESLDITGISEKEKIPSGILLKKKNSELESNLQLISIQNYFMVLTHSMTVWQSSLMRSLNLLNSN